MILAVSAPVIGFTWYLFEESKSAERALVATQTNLIADILHRKLHGCFSDRQVAFEQIAQIYANSATSANSVRYLTRHFERSYPELKSIRIIDAKLSTGLVYQDSKQRMPEMPPRWDAVRSVWQSHQTQTGGVFALPEGGNAISFYIPVLKAGQIIGVLEATLQLHEVFLRLFGTEVTDYWHLLVRGADGSVIYGWLPSDSKFQNSFFTRHSLKWLDQRWSFCVAPKPALYDWLQTPSPYRILLLGWLATAVVACATFLVINRQRRIEASLGQTRRLTTDIDSTRRQLADLINGVDAVVWTLDPKTYRYTFVSGGGEKLLDQPVSRWTQDADFWSTSIHPDDREMARHFHEKALATGADQSADYRMLRASGEVVWVKNRITPSIEAGQLTTLRGIIVDITQRKNAELNLRESEKRTREVMENMSLLIAVLDVQGRITFCNERFAQAVQWPRKELTGQLFFEMLAPPEQCESRRRDFEGMMKGHAFYPQRQTELVARSGKRRLVSWNIVLTRNADGSIAGLTGMGEDITERTAEEEALRQSQKLESLGILTGGIAHDFNNLLTAIMGNTELALQQVKGNDAACDHLNKIIATSKRLADLTRQMLAYSGKGNFIITQIDLNEVIQEMTSLIAVSVGKHIKMRYELASEPLWLMADAVQIEQVVLNLITNASEAIGVRPGEIVLHTYRDRFSEEQIQAGFANQQLLPGDYLCVEIVDNGCGMSAETLSKIFDPFFTTKFTGRGLGLAALQGIVRGHKGGVQIETMVGIGTKFKIYFPAANLEPVAAKKKATSSLETWSPKGVILVIDDETPLRSMAAEVLQAQGFEVLQAENGKEGLDIFQRQGSRITLVLLDLTMPVMGGEETFHRLKAIRPDVKILLTSGYSQEDAIDRFPTIGLAGFIQKPFLPSQLLERIRQAIQD